MTSRSLKSIVRAKPSLMFLIATVLAAGFGAFWIVRARQALEQAKADASQSRVRFQLRPLSDSKPAGVDFLPAPPDFRDAQMFHDSLYLAGAGGIWVYDLAGEARAAYLVGRDLPPSPPTAMAVGTIAGDAESKLWIGTAAGTILVFDGVRFSQIQLQDKGYGGITSLLMLPTGALLAGFSEAGVLAYDGAAIRPFHPTLRNISITALAGDDGDLWIGTRDRGVIHWQGGGAEEFQDQNGLPDNRVLSIAWSPDRVFVGTPVGTAEFRAGRRVRTIAEGVFGRTLLASNDRLLIGGIDEGVVEVKLDSPKVSRSISAAPLEPIAARRLIELQGIPFALASDGLFEQNPRSGLWMRRIGVTSASWTDRNVSALSLDGSGKLWIGYFDRGIDVADSQGVQKIAHIEDDHVFCINRLVWDAKRNTQVAATANGLVLFSPEGKIIRRIGLADGLISEHVTDVAVRADGLAAATAAGVTLLNAAGPESIYAFHGLANNHVYTLAFNGSRLLAGTLGGLSLIDDGFVRASYTTANSPLKQNWISAVVRSGDAWFIGTYGGGVLQMDAHGNWDDSPGAPPNTVINPNAMIAVSNRVFAGTLDRGLLAYDPAAHRWAPMVEGLPSLNVTALAASSTTLFIGTDNGVVRMPIEKVLQ
jgi:ligand-binding sensor domain-containing protein